MTLNMLVIIGSGKGILPDGDEPLLQPIFTYHQWSLVTLTLLFYMELFYINSIHTLFQMELFYMNSIHTLSFKIEHPKLQPYIPGNNALTIVTNLGHNDH